MQNWWEQDEVVAPQGGAAPAASLAPVVIGTPRAPKPKEPPAGFRWTADGNLEAIPGGPGDKPAPGVDGVGNTAFDNMSGLRKEFDASPEAKRYRAALPTIMGSINAPDTAQGDLAVVYGFAKAMDPESVVREGEMDMATATASVPAEFRAYVGRLAEGKRLPPDVRKGLIETMRRRGGEYNTAFMQARERYRQIAQQNGFDPNQVIGDHPGAGYQALEANFIGRPVRNADGTQGAAPTIARADTGRGEVVFGDTADAPPSPEMTPEQQAAYDALVSSGASADQIRAFGDKIGKRIENADEIVAFRDGPGGSVRSAADAIYNVPEETERLKERRDIISGRAGPQDIITQGMTLGLSDEAAGVGNMLANTITAPFSDATFDPAGAYQAGKGAEMLRLRDARGDLGAMGTALEIGGGFLSGNPTNALRAAPTLLGRVRQGARAGAAGGALAGFGYGNGLEGSALSAGGGALLGAGLGAAIPVAGAVVGNRVDGMRRLLGKDPALPRRLVGEAIEADSNTPRGVGQMMDDARGRGAPLMIADTGENARGLLASVGRQPGPARTLTRTAIVERQKEQFERVAAAVRRDLGPTANIREKSEELIEGAKQAAGPIYDDLYSRPGASSVKLDDLRDRPSMKRAFARAHSIAKEEGRDPTALGFDLDDFGEVTLTRVPSFQTLDYVKRGMDDVIEQFRDPVTGKLRLDEAGRAMNATLRQFLARVDKVAPEYAAARAAYAGPAKMRDALQKGSKALTRSPDDLAAEMKNMGEPEKEMYRMGLRKAIVDMMASRVDGGDKVSALVGTPKKRAALAKAFGGKAEFDRFIATLRDEEAMNTTYRSVATGSQTAERVAADAASSDAGLLESAVDAGLRGAGDTMWGATIAAIQKLREVDRFGAGKAGEATRESVATLLTETDPAVLRELVAAARRASALQRVKGRRAGRRAGRIGQNSGQLIGNALGSSTEKTR